jgi:exopolysaccharide biosynthesis polyprenyl glycosylphosphotransferase
MSERLAGSKDVPAALARTHDAEPQKLETRTAGVAGWREFYRHGVMVSDLVALTVAMLAAQVIRFGIGSGVEAVGPIRINYTVLGIVLVVFWWVSLQIFGTRDVLILGEDFTEYRLITRATVLMFGSFAIASLMLKWDMSRGFLAIALPLGLAGLVAERKLWRVWLRSHRRRGNHVSNALIIGGQQSAREIASVFARNPEAGLQVTGVWVPDGDTLSNDLLRTPDGFIPVLGTSRTLGEAMEVADATTIVVTDTEHIGHDGLRELTWQLAGVDVELLVSPNVMDVAGSRMQLKSVANLPFIHLQEPQFAEAGSWPKLWFDKVVATLVLVLASPLLLITALAIMVTSPGPVLFRQARIGLDGKPFGMLKFRSMQVDADEQLATMLEEQGSADSPLFKIEDDPRITTVGTFIRRFSIDELPQLWNVIRGDMSLVGPRPQRHEEVRLYASRDFRRLRVRPGMTGLWQVSGRSELAWEEAIKLDTYYVENWSMTGDLVILSRTVRAVLGSRGAT